MADTVRGQNAAEITRAAKSAGVPVRIASEHRVKVLAGNGKQDQGVLADVVAPEMRPLTEALRSNTPRKMLLLDGITTPANVGMILRTATAAGIGGIIVPRRGVASLDPMVVKASAGVAFRAPVLRCATAFEAAQLLVESGYQLYALGAKARESVFELELPKKAVFILGGETNGVSDEIAELVTSWISIPMPGKVESLNVSAAAAILTFELVRRGLS
jgi:23S rRNA (guanosine2251-2'-O)-methyltransferase